MNNASTAAHAFVTPWQEVLATRLLELHPNTPTAQRVALQHAIRQLGEVLADGHTQIAVSAESKQQLLPHPLVVDASAALTAPAPLVYSDNTLCFFRHWYAEHELAQHIKRLLVTLPTVNVEANDIGAANAMQQQAIYQSASHALTLITGGPGTGKTFTLVRIVKALQAANPQLRIALAAPTGKAAQRMQEVLQLALVEGNNDATSGIHAQTIHRLLGIGVTGEARFHANNPLSLDLLVIDEASMLDLVLAKQLFSAIATGTRVIVLGDADQLAAVEAGAVLADFCQSTTLAPYRIHLHESRRFAADQGIGKLAHAVLSGNEAALASCLTHHSAVVHYPLAERPVNSVYDALWQAYLPYASALQHSSALDVLFTTFDTFRLLTATRFGALGTRQLNMAMQVRLNAHLQQTVAPSGWFHGRPVMMLRNDAALGVSNGDIGLCLYDAQGDAYVHFPNQQRIHINRLAASELETAFAMTIHKSQGSEFNQVALLLADTDSNYKDSNTSSNMAYSRELIYTAMTRAKEGVQLWANLTTLQHAITHPAVRQTGLLKQLDG